MLKASTGAAFGLHWVGVLPILNTAWRIHCLKFPCMANGGDDSSIKKLYDEIRTALGHG